MIRTAGFDVAVEDPRARYRPSPSSTFMTRTL